MASPYKQDKRIASFETPMGDNELVVGAFQASEGMNEPFKFRIEALNTSKSILNFDDAIGKNCTITMNSVGGGQRFFDGILTKATRVATRHDGEVYRLVLRPWLWLLSRRRNSLIFHEKSAPDIIAAIFGDHPDIAKFERSLSKSYPTLEYCAQYRESDMDFACRLMEQHGISYHFRHKKGEHTLILGDGSSAYKAVDGGSRPFIGIEARHNRDTEHFFDWRPDRKFTTGKVTLRDYDFKKASTKVEADKTGDAAYAIGSLEDYDYPGKFLDEGEGKPYAEARLDSYRAEDNRYFADGDCASLWPGHLVTLKDHKDGSQNEQYLVLRCDHEFAGSGYRSEASAGDAPYRGTYELMRADKPYAPPEDTPKPFVFGPQTAKVVGKGEIDCDEYGRILVRFHWDRKSDESRRVRVAQVWAGQEWGGMFTPRIGMEVVVDFLEGDPDQPIIVGCVYNSDNKPPYLPGEDDVSGWKSHSTPNASGYNEFVFKDKAGGELVRMHAQRDLESKIENDERRDIIKDRDTTIGGNETLKVTGDVLIDATGEITIKSAVKLTLNVGGSTITMDGMSIKVESPSVDIQTSLEFKSKSNLLSQHEAGVTMVIKGTIVTIN